MNNHDGFNMSECGDDAVIGHEQPTKSQESHHNILQTALKLEIGDPQLTRHRKVPKWFDNGSQSHRYTTPKEYFRHQHFEACDLLIAGARLEERFDQ